MYNNVLAAIELSESSAKLVLEAARDIAGDETHLMVLHVVEPQYVQYSFDPTFTGSLIKSIEREAMESAERRVAELCEPYGVDESAQKVVMGHAASEIREHARASGADLIVMGTHGRRGWQRLLGSTAAAVLHGAPADVFMCRVAPEESS